MDAHTQGFAVGVLFCIVGWVVIRVVAATVDHFQTETYAAELDRQHPQTSDEDWQAHVVDALTVAKTEPSYIEAVEDMEPTAFVPVPLVRFIPTQRDGSQS